MPGDPTAQMDEAEESEGQHLFTARMDNARNLTNVLKAIHFKDVRWILLS